MARRKQQNPRHLETPQELATSLQNGMASGSDSEGDEHVCGRCRAEFPSLSDFLKHKLLCVSKRPVVVFSNDSREEDQKGTFSSSNEDEDNLSPPILMSMTTPCVDREEAKRLSVKLSDLPLLVQQLSDTNVTIEELRNTTVAVAQHGRNLQESQLAELLSNIHRQQVAQLHVIQELQAQILGVSVSPKSIPLVGTAALTPPQSGSESAMGVPAPNGTQPSAPTSARTSINSRNGVQNNDVSHEPNTLELLQRHTEKALQNTMAGGSFLLSSIGQGNDATRFKKAKDGRNDSNAKHGCKFCGKIFGSDSGLQIHLRSHTGERPFKCTVCGSCFSTKGNLKVHFQRHMERMETPNDFQNGTALSNAGASNGQLLSGELLQNDKALDFSSEKLADKNFPFDNLENGNGRSRSVTPNDLSMLSDDSIDGSGDELRINDLDDDQDSNSSPLNDNVDGDIDNQYGMRPPSYPSPSFTNYFRPTSFSGTLSDSSVCPPHLTSTPGGNENPVLHRDPSLYQELLPRIGSNDNSWESLMEVTETSETSKLQKLVDNIEVADPNQCIICHRVLSCKSALQMHYRTHTGERPFRCKICGRAFTTKGNLKTHMSVHRHKSPSRMLHQCPVCHRQFANSVILQQHIRMHTAVRGVALPDTAIFPENKNSTLLPPSYPRPMLMSSHLTSPEPLALTNSNARPSDSPGPQSHPAESFNKSSEPGSSQRSCISSPIASSSSSDTPTLNVEDITGSEEPKPPNLETSDMNLSSIHKVDSSESSSPINMMTGQRNSPSNDKERHKRKSQTDDTSSPKELKPATNGISTNFTLSTQTSNETRKMLDKNKGLGLLPMMMNLAGDKPLPMTLPSDCPIPLSLQSDRHIFPLSIPNSTSDYTASLAALENHVKAINSSTTNPLPFPPPLGLGFPMSGYFRQDYGFCKDKSLTYSPPNSKNGSDMSADERSTPGSFAKSDSPKSRSAESGALDLTPKGTNGSATSTPAQRHATDLKVFTPLAGLPFAPPPHTRHCTTCQICFKTFACQSALEIHYRSHTKERPFKCDVCDRGFSTKGNMKQHMLTHKIRDLPAQLFTSTPQPPYPVSEVIKKGEDLPKRTAADPGGSTPPKRSSGAPKHVCEVCHKPFSSGSALQIHMRTHTGVKPFQCNICSRAFTTKGNLKVHMGTHLSNNSTSRRGRRMSLDLSPLSLPLGNARQDLFFPYLPPFMNGVAQPPAKMNEISVIQSAGHRENDISSLVPLSLASANFPPVSRPLLMTSTPTQNIDYKRPVDEESPHRSNGRNRDVMSPARSIVPMDITATPERGASWGWKIACNRCNKICSSSTELELHISNEHMKKEPSDGVETAEEPKNISS